MNRIKTKSLLFKIFIPTTILTLSYFLLGHFCNIPHILLFCILATVILVPAELAMILSAIAQAYLSSFDVKLAIRFSRITSHLKLQVCLTDRIIDPKNCKYKDRPFGYVLYHNDRSYMVGVTGFEHATSWSRTKRSTKLSHTPKYEILRFIV